MMAKEIGEREDVEMMSKAAGLKGGGWISIVTSDYMPDC